ncbi:MAG: sulfate/molybdate ABC transporter ATP-binding protein [Isosphaeraceae bacterium]|nr:sulfate/molybdate ABC transporter ATP-binding protein [Isosphaeraceae bacterium]
MSIAVQGLKKRFGRFQAIDGVSFVVPSGELVALLGPSGSGKSTILRIIAGLEQPDAGNVKLFGEDATGQPVQARGVGFVSQHYALFRHMTVRENIAFGLETRRVSRGEVRERTDELLALVQLQGYAQRYPSQLSGGQRQRVALARALAPRPKVLLLDEPFGALDARVRQELRDWLRQLHEQTQVTSLIVTHDEHEAFEVADRLVVLNRGVVEQAGPPQELYERPATPFVAEFLGSVNLLSGRAVRGSAVVGDGMPLPGEVLVPDGPVTVYVRPHDLDIARAHNDGTSWPARVSRLVPLGALERVEVGLRDGTDLQIELTRERSRELALLPGDDVYVTPRESKVFRLDLAPLECASKV